MRHQRTTIFYPDAGFLFRIDSTSRKPEEITNRPLHAHSQAMELQYIHCGNGHYFIGDRFHALRPRTLCFIPAGTPHAFLRQDTSLALTKTTIIFSPALLNPWPLQEALAGWLRTTKNPARHCLCLSETNAARAEQLLALLGQEWSTRAPFYREAIVGYLRQFLIEIERCWRADTGTGHRNGLGGLMNRVLTLIDDSFAKPLTLADVASHVQRSACHVSHVFRQAQGLTFKDYLAARRVVDAGRLLQAAGNRKIFAIAMECGFGSLSSFNRTFQRLTGMSPSRYRCLNNPAPPAVSPVGHSLIRAAAQEMRSDRNGRPHPPLGQSRTGRYAGNRQSGSCERMTRERTTNATN